MATSGELNYSIFCHKNEVFSRSQSLIVDDGMTVLNLIFELMFAPSWHAHFHICQWNSVRCNRLMLDVNDLCLLYM